MGAARLKACGKYAQQALHKTDELFMAAIILLAVAVLVVPLFQS